MAEKKLKSVEYLFDWDVLCDLRTHTLSGGVLLNTAKNLVDALGPTIDGRKTLLLRVEGYVEDD